MRIRSLLRKRVPRKARELNMALGAPPGFRRIMPAFPCKLTRYYGPRASALRERIAYGSAHWCYGHVPVRVQNMLTRCRGSAGYCDNQF